MRKKTNWSAIFSFVAMCLALVAVIGVFSIRIPQPTEVNYDLIRGIVVESMAGLSIPTAQEIASKIDVQAPDTEKVEDIWENVYQDKIAELKEYAYNDTVKELEEDDYEALVDFLEENIENFDELISVYEDEDETEVTVINLGLEEEEDKVAEVEMELKIKYTLKEGEDTSYRDRVKLSSIVTYDEGDFDDEKVKLSFSM